MKISFNNKVKLAEFKVSERVVLAVPLFIDAKSATKSANKKNTQLLGSLEESSQKLIKEVDKLSGGKLIEEINFLKFSAKPGSKFITKISVPSKASKIKGEISLELFFLNNQDKNYYESVYKFGGSLAQLASSAKCSKFYLSLEGLKPECLEEFVCKTVEGLELGSYSFQNFKSQQDKVIQVSELIFFAYQLGRKDEKKQAGQKSAKLSKNSQTSENILFNDLTEKYLEEKISWSQEIAKYTNFARDLVNTPPTDMNPTHLLKEAKKISSKKGFSLTVFDKKDLEDLGANALLGVSRGSSEEPYMIDICFTIPAAVPTKEERTIVFVGKGITFDSGGLSIKPEKGMEDMKCDMAGAACVLSVMKTLGEISSAKHFPRANYNLKVHGIVPTCENMINGESIKPGDVVKAINGKTIEVLNTDAEGRLILADALSYAQRLKPNCIIDLATLTGACIVALGMDIAGLFSNDKKLRDEVMAAAKTSSEKLWELPLAKEYRSLIDSKVADLKNIGPGGPGATIGAIFLEEFVPENVPWVHLDIAGPAFVTKCNEFIKEGGTGFGVRTLVNFVVNFLGQGHQSEAV